MREQFQRREKQKEKFFLRIKTIEKRLRGHLKLSETRGGNQIRRVVKKEGRP